MKLLFGCALLLLCAKPLKATPFEYDLTGLVTQVGSFGSAGLAVGQIIPIVVTANPAYPQTSPGSGQYSFANGGNPITGFDPPISSATFGGVTTGGVFETVDVGGGLSISAYSPMGSGFSLDFSAAFDSVNGMFPIAIDPASVTAGVFSVSVFEGADAYGFSGVILGVPEPPAGAMVGASLVVLGATVRRYRSSAGGP